VCALASRDRRYKIFGLLLGKGNSASDSAASETSGLLRSDKLPSGGLVSPAADRVRLNSTPTTLAPTQRKSNAEEIIGGSEYQRQQATHGQTEQQASPTRFQVSMSPFAKERLSKMNLYYNDVDSPVKRQSRPLDPESDTEQGGGSSRDYSRASLQFGTKTVSISLPDESESEDDR
jgi:hypothetical protein